MYTINKHPLLASADPRALLLSGLALILSAAVIKNHIIQCVIILLCLIMLTGNMRAVFRRLLPVNLLALFIWLTVPFTAESGVALAALYTLRINACALLLMVFIVPMGVDTLANAMIRLKCPGKLVSVFMLTYRYIFVLGDRMQTSLTAMKLRKPASMGIIKTWRTYAALFATALTFAALRAERVQQAIMLRGFTGAFPATVSFKWRPADTFATITSVCIAAFLCYAQLCLK